MFFFQSLINSLPGTIAQGLVWGVMAVGVYITFRILDIADLTVDGSLCTGAAVCVVLLTNGYNVYICMLAAIIAGCLAGLVTGLLITRFGIPPILSGILTQLSLYSINLHIMGWGTDVGSKANLPVAEDGAAVLVSLRNVRSTGLNNPTIVLVILTVVMIGILYWYFGTEMGSSLRATGANQAMAKANGINTNLAKVIGLMISNGLVALSGALLAQFQGFSDINMGRGAIVIGLASVIIGEVLLSKVFRNFAFKLLSCVIGSIIYYIVITIVLKLGLSTDDLKLLTAVVVALFLGVPYWQANFRSRFLTKGE